MDPTVIGIKELQLAAGFPYLSKGKSIIKESGLSLEKIPPTVSKVALAYLKGESFPESLDKEFLHARILAYPLAKIYLLLLKNHSLMERFADRFSLIALESLDDNQLSKMGQKALDIYFDLGIPFEPAENSIDFFLPLADYLNIPKRRFLKRLIDLDIQNNRVRLTAREAKELASDFCRKKILDSFTSEPFDSKSIPEELQEKTRAFSQALLAEQHEKLAKLSGPVRLQAFPPCMAELYTRLSSGENLNHISRFNLAVFLLNVNMSEEEIVAVFAKAPNFDEKKTRYHLKSLSKDGKPYTLSNCETLRGHQLCIQNGALCPGIVNPLQYYRKSAQSGKPLVEPPSGGGA